MNTVVIPSGIVLFILKNVSSDTPIIKSGKTKGMYDRLLTYFFTAKLYHFIPIEPKVAIITDKKDELRAIMILLQNVIHNFGELKNNCLYHFSENELQVYDFVLLNDSIISINIGR